MATYALWWFGVDAGGNYVVRSNATAADLSNRGFTFAIALEGEGESIPQSRLNYQGGRDDGRAFGQWIDSKLSGIDYLVENTLLSKGHQE